LPMTPDEHEGLSVRNSREGTREEKHGNADLTNNTKRSEKEKRCQGEGASINPFYKRRVQNKQDGVKGQIIGGMEKKEGFREFKERTLILLGKRKITRGKGEEISSGLNLQSS